jgi:hypothetical protein
MLNNEIAVKLLRLSVAFFLHLGTIRVSGYLTVDEFLNHLSQRKANAQKSIRSLFWL